MNEDAGERAEKYIQNVERALENLTSTNLPTSITGRDLTSVLDTVKRYVSDARFYLQEGKTTTSLASISYAEGLLDAMKFLKIINMSWQSKDYAQI